MTGEEKQKAINALKISAPIMAVTQEEFKDYIQTLNKIMDLLEQETVSRESYEHEYFLRKEFEIDKLKQQIPKAGHWISHKEHCDNLGVMPSGLGAYKWCSNCDCGIDVMEWHRNNYNYCPNCGAKMESEE